MTERLIAAGAGGQGVMLLGKLLAEAAMHEGMNVTFLPSYGPEMRGGTAHCHVVVSESEVFSPLVEEADTLIIFNQASYERFGVLAKPGGLVVVNSSMVEVADASNDVRFVRIPATEKANELGNALAANMIMLGAYNAARGLVPHERIVTVLESQLKGRRDALLELNTRAYKLGAELGSDGM